jgi:rRNA-processing protein FCF1
MAGNRIVLDSGAVSALANGEEAIRVALAKALTRRVNIVIPTVVVVESTTTSGPRDAAVNRALKLGSFVDCDIELARAAAALRYLDGAKTGAIDAIVIATADKSPGSIVLTGDAGDLRRLAQVRCVSRVLDVSNIPRDMQ